MLTISAEAYNKARAELELLLENQGKQKFRMSDELFSLIADFREGEKTLTWKNLFDTLKAQELISHKTYWGLSRAYSTEKGRRANGSG